MTKTASRQGNAPGFSDSGREEAGLEHDWALLGTSPPMDEEAKAGEASNEGG